MNKKQKFNLITLLLIVIITFSLSACGSNFVSVEYSAGNGGSIIGQASQTVKNGGDAEIVTAMPDTGYRFVKWSDSLTDATRQDKNIATAINVIAEFEKIVNTYAYNYNYATENNTIKNIELKYEDLEQASFVVPKREHCIFNGWYLDEDFSTQVSDDQGSLKIGYEIFESESRSLYAKWTGIDDITYKILMIYVTEVNATLVTLDGVSVDVDYKMSEIEKKVCEAITIQFAAYLNKVFSGLIKFEADSYFTTVALGEENIEESIMTQADGSKFKNFLIMADKIPEINGMLKNYRCVLSTFCLNDYDGLLHRVGGYGGYKYGALHFENMIGQTLANGDSIESLYDLTYNEWDGMMQHYSHEFAHTIEQGLSVYPYHSTLGHYSAQGIYYGTTELYLLNQAIVDAQRVGIPYPYWTEEVFTLNYIAEQTYYGGEMGWIEGNMLPNGMPQRVAKGYDAFSVTATPLPGYVFTGWSDGVMTTTRTDTNIQSDLNLIAYFEPINLE